MLTDLRFALRQFGKSPSQAAIIILLLALGLGANTAIFSIINGVLFKPLPYPEGDRLVAVWNTFPRGNLPKVGTSAVSYADWRAGINAFADSAIYETSGLNYVSEHSSQRLTSLLASPSLFTTLGVQPILGRTFTDDETKPGSERVIVLTHDFWKSDFNKSPDVLGQTVKLNGLPYQIIGVLPEWFKPPQTAVRFIRPVVLEPADLTDARRGWVRYNMIGRLKAGATIEQALAQCRLVNERIKQQLPNTAEYWASSGHDVILESFLDSVVGAVRPTLLVL